MPHCDNIKPAWPYLNSLLNIYPKIIILAEIKIVYKMYDKIQKFGIQKNIEV